MTSETNHHGDVPDGFELARTTDVFDNDTVPAGLLKAHRVGAEVWGRLIVHTGVVTFVFEDDLEHPIVASPDQAVAIPPGRPHHLELDQPATFAVEFHRPPSGSTAVSEGRESGGLD